MKKIKYLRYNKKDELEEMTFKTTVIKSGTGGAISIPKELIGKYVEVRYMNPNSCENKEEQLI